jgi:hypothetical protein
MKDEAVRTRVSLPGCRQQPSAEALQGLAVKTKIHCHPGLAMDLRLTALRRDTSLDHAPWHKTTA